MRTSELKNSVIDENSLFIWQTNNAIFIVRVMTKFMMEKIKEEDVVRQFNVVLPDEEELPEAMFPLFLRQLCELIVETPLAPPTYSLLTEATRLLTVLLSSPLFCPPGKSSTLNIISYSPDLRQAKPPTDSVERVDAGRRKCDGCSSHKHTPHQVAIVVEYSILIRISSLDSWRDSLHLQAIRVEVLSLALLLESGTS